MGAVVDDANWILGAIRPDGAICHYVDKVAIRPYIAHFAALGLVDAYRVSQDSSYITAVWNWLQWYVNHMDVNGYVTDYNISGGVATSTGDMDSTDSYAALFLKVLREAYNSTGDLTKLQSFSSAASLAVSAILSTKQSDGLTWAKPTWQVKYLMDNCEVYAGFVAAEEIATVLGNSALASTVAAARVAVAAGIDTYWDAGNGNYKIAKNSDGSFTSSSWATLYPDAVAQMWPTAWGLPTNHADVVLPALNSNQPNWDHPGDYWPVPAWAFSFRDLARARSAYSNIRTQALSLSRAWPFTPGNAGQLINLACLTEESGFRPMFGVG